MLFFWYFEAYYVQQQFFVTLDCCILCEATYLSLRVVVHEVILRGNELEEGLKRIIMLPQ